MIKLIKFDIKSIKSDKLVVCIGNRKAGRSILIKDLLYYHTDIPFGTVISHTNASNPFYGNIFPNTFIHDTYNPQILENLVKRQKIVRKNYKNDYKIDPRVFLILDNCLVNSNCLEDFGMKNIFYNSRCFSIFPIFSIPYSLSIPPNFRSQIDFIFIFGDNNIYNREKMYKQYGGMFSTFEIFCQVMDDYTQDYNCLVINNNSSRNKREDNVLWYKAQIHN
mgnify:CR=1 FL=1|uniref:Uncharacterized protein n=1 Tax=viral metagenome TaxID=1070528 RepID=A0A6C0J6W0_9ZZZZ